MPGQPQEEVMSRTLKQLLFWTPRLAGILFILFLSMFALDIFGTGLSFWDTVVALFMHLIPSIVLAIAVAVAWKWEWVGAVLFSGWAILYAVLLGSRGFDWFTYAMIGGLPILIGLIFLAGWIWRKQIRGV
jgi:uncharacterized membrane protein YeiB